MGDLGEYLSEFGAAAAPTPRSFAPAPLITPRPIAPTAPAPAPTPGLDDTAMWTLDARWLPSAKYVDTSVCFRVPNFGGSVVMDNTQEYYAHERVCKQWDGYDTPSSCSSNTYWELPCTDEARLKWTFQYQRYRWAQQRLLEHLRARPAAVPGPLAAASLLAWCLKATGLLSVAVVATNVRFGNDDGDRWYSEGFFPTLPVSITRPSDTPDSPHFVYARVGRLDLTHLSKAKMLPHPGGLRHGTRTLFPVIPVARGKGQFELYPSLPMPARPKIQNVYNPDGFEPLNAEQQAFMASKYGFGSAATGYVKWAVATVGRGFWIADTLPGGTQVAVQTIDAYAEGLALSIQAVLNKSFFDWIKTALELYSDRLTVHFGRAPAGSLQLDQAATLRQINETVMLTNDMRAQEAAYGNTGFNTITSVLITGISAINGAVGAIVGVVLSFLQSGLQELVRAFASSMREEQACPYPPFLRIQVADCDMPITEEAIRALFPSAARSEATPDALRRAMQTLQADTRTFVREALPPAPPPSQTCPAGHTGTPPNCVPTASKSGSGTLVIGVGTLLLLSQLLKR